MKYSVSIFLTFISLFGCSTENTPLAPNETSKPSTVEAGKLIVTKEKAGGEREELLCRGKMFSGSREFPCARNSEPAIYEFAIHDSVKGGVSILMLLNVEPQRYRAFVMKFRDGQGNSITLRTNLTFKDSQGNSIRFEWPSDEVGWGKDTIEFWFPYTGAPIEDALINIEDGTGTLWLYGIR